MESDEPGHGLSDDMRQRHSGRPRHIATECRNEPNIADRPWPGMDADRSPKLISNAFVHGLGGSAMESLYSSLKTESSARKVCRSREPGAGTG